jgi:hypothetical protein
MCAGPVLCHVAVPATQSWHRQQITWLCQYPDLPHR